jgi:hypothetical protein
VWEHVSATPLRLYHAAATDCHLLLAGRATHIHNKVHIIVDDGADIEAEYNTSRVSHTGQFFFEDSFLDMVYQLYPYRSEKQQPLISNLSCAVPNCKQGKCRQ